METFILCNACGTTHLMGYCELPAKTQEQLDRLQRAHFELKQRFDELQKKLDELQLSLKARRR